MRDTIVAFVEDKVDRFFEAGLHEDDDDHNEAPVNQASFKYLEAFIEEIKERFNRTCKKDKSIIIQRDPERFWSVLLRQILNVKEHDIRRSDLLEKQLLIVKGHIVNF